MLASNVSGIAGKWLPYYFKPFNLGRQGDGLGSTDGETYITQTTPSSGGSDEALYGSCTSDYNCGFYYTLTFVNTLNFHVEKYDLNDNLIDTIYASSLTGDGRYWSMTNVGSVTIDIGVNIMFPHTTSWENGDVFKITLPTFEQMEKRKIYHGGYSTFLRLAQTEGFAYHSDIIPTNLKGKNMSVIYNPPNGLIGTSGTRPGLQGAKSRADSTGNQSSTLLMEWNANNDALTEDVAGNASVPAGTFGWSANETWALGSVIGSDLNPDDADDCTTA